MLKLLLAAMLTLFVAVGALTVEWWLNEQEGTAELAAPLPTPEAPPILAEATGQPAATSSPQQEKQEKEGASSRGSDDAGATEEAVTGAPTGSTFASGGGVRISIPALGVDASVNSMGVDAAGVMQVPDNAYDVAWYNFSADPGAPGNAVMGGHVDYGGRTGVFAGLAALRPGDHVVVRDGGREFVYAVQQTYAVRPEEADVESIIGSRSGAATLTLITCGGTFDPSVRQYDHRVIVETALISS